MRLCILYDTEVILNLRNDFGGSRFMYPHPQFPLFSIQLTRLVFLSALCFLRSIKMQILQSIIF